MRIDMTRFRFIGLRFFNEAKMLFPSLLACALIPTVSFNAFAADSDAVPASLEAGRKHWAFQPVVSPPLPAVKLAAWIQSPIDAFILARLEANGLTPASPADRRTLLRRATFDLTGLPPTPDELEAFMRDHTADAFVRVVERLLESPHYGERWGRHWLDVARYADSNGLDENVAHGNAWRYRDAVVNAFNADKPFDQFIVEQIAGDLLPAADFKLKQERLTATAFLSLGAKVLAEPDPKKMEMDIIDEQIDTLGRAFMGLTLGCARCHDHKFDPIPTADYYALAAIFKSTRTMNHFKIVAEWHEPLLATAEEIAAKEAHDKEIAARKDAISRLTSQANEVLRAEVRARAADYLAAAAMLPPNAATNEIESIARKAGLHSSILKQCRDFLAKGTTNTVFRVWQEAVKKGSAAGVEVERHYRPLFGSVEEALEALKKESGSITNVLADEQLEFARQALDDPKGFLAVPPKAETLYPTRTVEALKRARDELASLEKRAPEMPSTMGVTEATNVLQSLAVHLRGSHLTLGAEVRRGFPQVVPAASARPQFNEKQSGRLELARWLTSPAHPLTARVMVNRIWRWHFGQGLVASTENFGVLGDRPSHPELLDWLAARFVSEGWSVKAMHRLIMNSAVYRQAGQLSVVSDQYSVGQLDRPVSADHRLLNTDYSPPSSRAPTSVATIDPENRLLSHFSIRRLEAEEIRDSLLAVAGLLDRTMGGKTLPLKNREFVFNHTSKDATTYESPRRALYLPIIRNHLYDLLEQFDFPDPAVPTGSRHETVIAPQALLMMNAELVANAAERLAKQICTESLGDWQRLEKLYVKAYARPPSAREIERARAFLAEFDGTDPARNLEAGERTRQAWAALCHAILAANEFCYLN